MMKLPGDKDGLNGIGVDANKELCDSIRHESNNTEDKESIGSIMISRDSLNE